jgi:hypothetical protein
LTNENSLIYAGHFVLLGWWNWGGYDKLAMLTGWSRYRIHTEFWWENLLENVERLRIKWEDNIEMRCLETGFNYQRWMGLAQSVSNALYGTNEFHTGNDAVSTEFGRKLTIHQFYTISLCPTKIHVLWITLSGYPFPFP